MTLMVHQHSPDPTATHIHDAPTAPHAMDHMGYMMSNTFSTSTTVTLLFTGWTTRTPAQYFGALVFLFFLTLLNRFLGAWRSQLHGLWAEQAFQARLKRWRKSRERKLRDLNATGGTSRGPTPRIRSGRRGSGGSEDVELTPLSPMMCKSDAERRPDDDAQHPASLIHSRHLRASTPPGPGGLNTPWSPTEIASEQPFISPTVPGPKWTRFFGGRRWQASNPWRFTLDVPRAVLEFVRAGIGYVLMLAVMTFNVGFLFAVLGGVLVGEMLLGRYSTAAHGTNWDEGACHE